MHWDRFKNYYYTWSDLGFSLDISRMRFPDSYLKEMENPVRSALVAMNEIEKGAVANVDENRMVGHYWLRQPDLAPDEGINREIRKAWADLKSFVTAVHSGEICGCGGSFEHLLIIGIGGSALGPQFVADALGLGSSDRMSVNFFDNTDPDGMDRILQKLTGLLDRTLCLVISKSGGTAETRNGMLEAAHAYSRAGINFGSHAVAITGADSQLDQKARREKWLKRFPMWDWVGGRTSETALVGLLPAALQGIDIETFLRGAADMDALTRTPDPSGNPAALLALMWYFATDGRGAKDMVILPYKDRLALLSKYLQQLIMESLGKEMNRKGEIVNQGIAVYGNKGSTDQHAYVQQLREGVPNFFVTFIEVLKDREGRSIEVDPDTTTGDYLEGFFLGTRDALDEKQRDSLTLTIEAVNPHSVGMLIALYERTVGLYAELIEINAYHQPGVEAGKKAAAGFLDLKRCLVQFLRERKERSFTVEEVAEEMNISDGKIEAVYKILNHLSANPGSGVQVEVKKPFYKSRFRRIF